MAWSGGRCAFLLAILALIVQGKQREAVQSAAEHRREKADTAASASAAAALGQRVPSAKVAVQLQTLRKGELRIPLNPKPPWIAAPCSNGAKCMANPGHPDVFGEGAFFASACKKCSADNSTCLECYELYGLDEQGKCVKVGADPRADRLYATAEGGSLQPHQSACPW